MTRWAAGVAVGLFLAPASAAEAWPPPRKVFAHHVPWHPPSHARPDRTSDAQQGIESQIRHAAAAGIDGFAVDVVLRPPTRIIPTLLKMADIAQRIAPGFAIMPCLDAASPNRTTEAWAEFLLAWLGKTAALPTTCRVNGAVVVFTYGAYSMPADAWAEVRRRLDVAGHRLFLIGEVHGLYRTKSDPLERIRPYAEVFDGLYFFAPNSEEHERKLIGLLTETGQPKLCVYSPTPGYWRVNTGVFARPYRGTRTYREHWDAALKLPVHWASITTWNDYSEHTHIEPSRNFSDAYARLTQIGAARFRGEPKEDVVGDGSFWLAAPSEMPDGPGRAPTEASRRREIVFEVLRIGPRTDERRPVSVTIALPSGEPLERRTLTIDGRHCVADQQFEWQPDRTLDVRYLTVEASIDAAKARLPIAILPRCIARRFYMAPRRARLTGAPSPRPTLTLRGRTLDVTPLPPPEGYRVDLLHNLMHRPDPKSRTARVAEGRAQLPSGPPVWGFWQAAAVAPDSRVAWAAPLFIAPQGDPSLLALYTFDDEAKPGRDSSVYERHARLRGRTVALADGGRALVCDTDSWCQPEGSFCPIDAPITVELWAWPKEPGGMLWGDVGAAMLLSLDGRGVPTVRRHATKPARWVTARAAAPIPMRTWSHLAGVFEGGKIVLYVNGKMAASTPCLGPSGSSRMGIGRNPYDMSNVFNGFIDDVRLTARALRPSEFGPVAPGKDRPAAPQP